MPIGRTLSFIVKHPLNRGRSWSALGRFTRWQVGSRLLGQPALLPMAGDCVLVARRGDTGATGNYYCGLHEHPDMLFVIHALRPGEMFLDVGANIGSYSVLASRIAGARVVACEPVASANSQLRKNIGVNEVDSLVQVRRCAVGESTGVCSMTRNHDTANHVMTDGSGEEAEQVEMVPMDSLVAEGEARLAKIDVEGFELNVLRGGRRVLDEPALRGVVIELNGCGSRYGVRDEQVDEVLRSHGLTPSKYDPETRQLSDAAGPNSSGNTIYVRKSSDVQSVVGSAPKVNVFGRWI